MRKTFVIISVSDRVNELNALMESIIALPQFDSYDACLHYQDYLGNAGEIKHKERYKHIIITPQKMGCNGARVYLLQRISNCGYDVYINLDDDMLLVPQTNYDKAIQKALCADVGFVLTNWARSEKLLKEKIPKMQERYIPQTMVYQGGGMIYSEKIAELIRQLPVEKTMFDDVWPITAYVNGYTNYRYLGSLALHFVCRSGGMRLFMQEECPKLACPEYINYRKGKRPNEWLIPMDSDISEFAHFLHMENLKK